MLMILFVVSGSENDRLPTLNAHALVGGALAVLRRSAMDDWLG